MKKTLLTLCTLALLALPGCCPKCTAPKAKKPAAAQKTTTKKTKKVATKKAGKKYSHIELKPVDDLLT